MFNLGQGKQILILEEWNDNLSGIPASKYLRVEFYHITRNTKRGMLQKRRLASVPCSRIPFLKDAGNIDFLIECVEFDSETELGLETTSGNTNYVQADVLPCEQDCEIYVSDVGYEEVISEFLRYF